jgi:hypothetical protein
MSLPRRTHDDRNGMICCLSKTPAFSEIGLNRQSIGMQIA